jgi:RNA polymerase sigma-70 factor (ECF subfamily)
MPPARDDPRSDDQLVSAIKAGDADAFEALYRRHRDWVFRLAHRFTVNHEDALEVLQETFWYLARQFPGFELRAKLTTYLYPVVKNIALTIRRKRRPSESLPEIPTPNPIDPASTRAELAAALARLSDEQREVVLLRFVDDLALAEIAEAMNIPLGTVKSRLHSAFVALRDDPRTRQYFED